MVSMAAVLAFGILQWKKMLGLVSLNTATALTVWLLWRPSFSSSFLAISLCFHLLACVGCNGSKTFVQCSERQRTGHSLCSAFLMESSCPAMEQCWLRGLNNTGQMKLPACLLVCSCSQALCSNEVSQEPSRALPEVFWFVDSCVNVDLCWEIGARVS